MLALKRLLGDLAPFNPTLVGTYPLGLQTSRSDLDILCCSDDLARFERALAVTLLELGLSCASPRRVALAPEATVTHFECGGMPVEERRRVYQDVLAVYRKLGADLTPVDLPDLSIAGTIGFILETESAASFDDLTRSGDVDLLRTGTSASSWANTFKSARFVPAVEYLRAQRARVLLMRQMDDFMSKYDALLSAGSDSTLGVTNLTGHPAIALKCSIYNNDTPVMLMVTGKLYEEATICRVAMAYEQATDWKDKHPTLA